MLVILVDLVLPKRAKENNDEKDNFSASYYPLIKRKFVRKLVIFLILLKVTISSGSTFSEELLNLHQVKAVMTIAFGKRYSCCTVQRQ